LAKQLINPIKGTRLEITKRGKDYKYGSEGTIYPGHYTTAIVMGHRPPEGKSWIRDYNSNDWEVETEELAQKTEHTA
jgi:hypothetical protein